MNRNNGFTLIELLISLVLMSILALMINAVLSNSIDSVQAVKTNESERESIESLNRALKAALREAQEINLSNAEKVEARNAGEYDSSMGDLRFSMAPDRIGFCLKRPFMGEEDGMMYWIEIIIAAKDDDALSDDDSQGYSLILRQTPYLQGSQEPLGFDDEQAKKLDAREFLLLDKLRVGEFSFWILSDEQPTDTLSESFPEYEVDEEIDEEGQLFSEKFPEFLKLRLVFASGKEYILSFLPGYEFEF